MPRRDAEQSDESDHDLLIRIDARTADFEEKLRKFVTQDEFAPVRNLVYGLVAIVLIGVAVAVVALVVNQPKAGAQPIQDAPTIRMAK